MFYVCVNVCVIYSRGWVCRDFLRVFVGVFVCLCRWNDVGVYASVDCLLTGVCVVVVVCFGTWMCVAVGCRWLCGCV